MRYPSNLSDEEWEIIKKFVEPSSKGRKNKIPRRSIIDAIFYQSKTGCQWQYLPNGFPNYKTVNRYYNQWVQNGTWEAIHSELFVKCRSALGKKPECPTVGIIDSQSVKNAQGTEELGYDAGKKIKGIKRHIVTDTNGLLLAVNVHSASIQDRQGGLETLLKAKSRYPSLQQFFADGGYSGELQNQCLLKTKVLLSIIKRTTEKFEILPIRWIVERTFAWLNNFRRLSKQYEHSIKSATGQIYVAMIRIMLNRLKS